MLKKYGIDKVLIVYRGAHHGNGTQEIFDSDPSVFYFSAHEWPLYPGTGSADDVGRDKAKETKLNCPIIAGYSSRVEIINAFLDPLGGLNL